MPRIRYDIQGQEGEKQFARGEIITIGGEQFPLPGISKPQYKFWHDERLDTWQMWVCGHLSSTGNVTYQDQQEPLFYGLTVALRGSVIIQIPGGIIIYEDPEYAGFDEQMGAEILSETSLDGRLQAQNRLEALEIIGKINGEFSNVKKENHYEIISFFLNSLLLQFSKVDCAYLVQRSWRVNRNFYMSIRGVIRSGSRTEETKTPSRTIMEKVAKERKSMLLDVALIEDPSMSLIRKKAATVLVIPVMDAGRNSGVLYLESGKNNITQNDFYLIESMLSLGNWEGILAMCIHKVRR